MDTEAEILLKRQTTLEQLRRMLPVSEAWESWLKTCQELPPDFSAMTSSWELPDPLVLLQDGKERPLAVADDWKFKRKQLQEQFQQWMFGKTPPPPENMQVQNLESVLQDGAVSRKILLTFGPDNRASLHLELLIPDGDGPFPVFLTQSDHRGWALIALQRGYIGAVYAACDEQDDSLSYQQLYPAYDWAGLPRRAWAASRVVDYLLTLHQVNPAQILLTGHSRNAKQALIASAFDERISAVIASSAGALGSLPTRFFSEQNFGEGIELITRVFPEWFHPRLRFFVGREDCLPVDMHELVALSAPRFCLISTALNDRCESAWAAQQSFIAAQRVYRFLGATEKLSLMWRPGGHETYTEIVERYLDWSDGCFGRSQSKNDAPRFIYPVNWLVFPQRYKNFRSISNQPQDPTTLGTLADWQKAKNNGFSLFSQILGNEPPNAANPGHDYGVEVPYLSTLLDHHTDGADVIKRQVVFGEYINADIYLPRKVDTRSIKLPVVLWLPPFSFPNGYRAAYFHGEQLYSLLARQGYAVFCFDPIGMGRRVEEAESFYQRYPRWSLLGKMLRDAFSALDVLVGQSYIDAHQIFGVGYGLGSLVGLHLAALDERLAGLAAVSVPTFCQPGQDQRQFYDHYNLVPRLAEYTYGTTELPYSCGFLMASCAPRPLLVVSPQFDRETPLGSITASVESARQVYSLRDASAQITQASPEDYNHLSNPVQQIVLDWLDSQVKKKTQL